MVTVSQRQKLRVFRVKHSAGASELVSSRPRIQTQADWYLQWLSLQGADLLVFFAAPRALKNLAVFLN